LRSDRLRAILAALSGERREMESLDCVVIGAGVVGLAIARRLALSGREVVVLEAEAGAGKHTSSRNSEVIHAGIYYPPASLKARLCVAGNRALYAYLAERDVPHRRIGKLLIAVCESEIPTLERLSRLAEENGVRDLVALSAADVRSLEPAVVAVRGVFSPSTGILDSHALMRALEADLQAARGTVVLSAPVMGAEVEAGGVALDVGGKDPVRVKCKAVVNSAGLHAPSVARTIRGLRQDFVPREYFARGHYFVLTGRSPFKHLVYPMPAPGALGIHVTLDLAGRARFGPDITWTQEVSYAFDEGRAQTFYDAIRRYYPGLAGGALEAGYVGIRPKIVPEGAPAADFVVQGPETHGVPGLVNLFGIESPGLTACLAIADEVAARLG
jgi:L-2-hydroxyglutarate oxidase LhgO